MKEYTAYLGGERLGTVMAASESEALEAAEDKFDISADQSDNLSVVVFD